jgi:hypothetical protein
MHHKQLLNSDQRKVEDHFERKLSCWKEKHLSYGGRLVLLNSVLSSLPIFMMSFFEIPKGALKKLDQYNIYPIDHSFSVKEIHIKRSIVVVVSTQVPSEVPF